MTGKQRVESEHWIKHLCTWEREHFSIFFPLHFFLLLKIERNETWTPGCPVEGGVYSTWLVNASDSNRQKDRSSTSLCYGANGGVNQMEHKPGWCTRLYAAGFPVWSCLSDPTHAVKCRCWRCAVCRFNGADAPVWRFTAAVMAAFVLWNRCAHTVRIRSQ